jgi:hypothetical protein
MAIDVNGRSLGPGAGNSGDESGELENVRKAINAKKRKV